VVATAVHLVDDGGAHAVDVEEGRLMRTVVYAVNEPCVLAHREHVRDQLTRSLASLRAHNRNTTTQIFGFGDVRELAPIADRHRVELVERGAYRDALEQHCSPSRAAVLAHYPVLHKWLALAGMKQGPDDQVLYIDNDTFFFDDVDRLFDTCGTSDFHAREEPFSSRSAAGYRPEYIDETKLFALAAAEGCRPLPTYNLGAVVLNHAMGTRLAPVIGDLLDCIWRLCLGIVRDVDPKAYVGETQLEVMARDLPALRSSGALATALAYPSSNYWIVEQIGLLLALGRMDRFTHGALEKQDAIQGVEYHFWPPSQRLPILAHYYSSNTRAFFNWWEARSTSP
jgi:hypothetical protein